MRWKQFFTPVKSMQWDEAKDYMQQQSGDSYTLLDVRQPQEYEKEHLPGAQLIPIGDLGDRLDEIDPGKTTIVY